MTKVALFLCASAAAWAAEQPAAQLAEGRRVYQQHCQACHGRDGKWTLPMRTAHARLRPLDKLMARSDAKLIEYLQFRVDTTDFLNMMKSGEIRDLVVYLRTFQDGFPDVKGPAPSPVNRLGGLPAAGGDAGKGAAVYLRRCHSCHGKDGNGTEKLRAAYGDALPRFGSEAFWTGHPLPLEKRIERGGHENVVDGIAPAEFRDLLAHLRAFRGKEPAAAAGAAPNNDACLACHDVFANERLSVAHLARGVTCRRCHGRSNQHLADATKAPQVMFARASVDEFCLMCHPKSRPKPGSAPRKQTCADPACHGKHRLDARTRLWDKATGIPHQP